MPKITPPEFVEGDVVEKRDITDLRDSINTNLIDEIDGSNIREEGLDRRVFKEGSVVPKFTTTQRLYSSTIQTVASSQNWRIVSYDNADDLKGNKYEASRAVLPIEWNTETDTHCVIRLSMYVDSQSGPRRPVEDAQNYWDFGLLVVSPGESRPSGFPTTGFEQMACFTKNFRVSPFQRVGLNNAFNRDRTQGYFTKGQSNAIHRALGLSGDFDEANVDNQRRRVGSSVPSSNVFSYHEETYPRGAWYQYAFDRASNFNSSFSMTCHATSELSRASQLNANFMWPFSGTAKIYVMYRSNLAVPNPPVLDVHNLNLSAQIYRR